MPTEAANRPRSRPVGDSGPVGIHASAEVIGSRRSDTAISQTRPPPEPGQNRAGHERLHGKKQQRAQEGEDGATTHGPGRVGSHPRRSAEGGRVLRLGALPSNGYSVPGADVRGVIPDRVVLCTPVVPEGDRMLLPPEATLKSGALHVVEQEVE